MVGQAGDTEEEGEGASRWRTMESGGTGMGRRTTVGDAGDRSQEGEAQTEEKNKMGRWQGLTVRTGSSFNL